MHTTLFLVRAGETEWSKTRRIPGRRDIALSDVGRAQAETAQRSLGALNISEVICSPLQRSVETAEIIAAVHQIPVARDPRLTALHVGSFEGQTYDELARNEAYRAFIADPVEHPLPGAESIGDVFARIHAAVEQALVVNELGASIVMVSHGVGISVLISYFLGTPLNRCHQLHIGPASIAILRVAADRSAPTLLGLNVGMSLGESFRLR